jgi:hypothetical protein
MAKPTTLSRALKQIEAKLHELRQKKIKALLRPLQKERRKLEAKIAKINKVIGRALKGFESAIRGDVASPVKVGRKRKRIRRGADDLKKIALGVVELVKTKRKEGVTPAEITAQFGKLAPSPFQFVKKFANVTLLRKGPEKRPRYYL